MKAQGALEYLLLIGGAVLVAAIVIALITGLDSEPTLEPDEDWKFVEACLQEQRTGNIYGQMTCEDIGLGWEPETPSDSELYCVKCIAKDSIECLFKDGVQLCDS